MTFIVYGPGVRDPFPVDKLFRRHVEETRKTNATHAVKEMGEDTVPERILTKQAGNAYHTVEQLPQDEPVMYAHQIMHSPVFTLSVESTVGDAIRLFREKKFRHVPVVSTENMLVGIVSDRDVFHHLSGLTEDFYLQTKGQNTSARLNELVGHIMQESVLTANASTDVRYIAQVLVEQHVGAMPIMEHDALVGIITRSDILRAVMQHFSVELWV